MAVWCVLFSNGQINYVWFSAANISETITDEVLQRLYGPDTVVAEIKYQAMAPQQFRLSDIPVTEKLEKFVEDVKWVSTDRVVEPVAVYML